MLSGLRHVSLLFEGFAVLALALAAIGVYGVFSYPVAQRTREIGVRVAVGATPRGTQHAVLGVSLRLRAGGSADGLGLTLAARRFLASQLYGIEASDPLASSGRRSLSSCLLLWPPGCPRGVPLASIRWSRCGRSEHLVELAGHYQRLVANALLWRILRRKMTWAELTGCS